MANILIVDDDPEVNQLIKLHIDNAGFNTITAQSGIEAIQLLTLHDVHLIVLDLMMENGNGFDVLKHIKGNNMNSIIIVFSALNEIRDKISTLSIGADDYMTKPFSPIELVARVQAHLRRQFSSYINPFSDQIKINRLILNKDNLTVHFENNKQSLTQIESNILELLIKNADKVLTKREIYQHIWQHDNFDDNNLSVFISRIRKILDSLTGQSHIQSIRGVGYRFNGEDT